MSQHWEQFYLKDSNNNTFSIFDLLRLCLCKEREISINATKGLYLACLMPLHYLRAYFV